MKKIRRFEVTSTSLHVMASVFMLCDHLWGTVVPGNDWLTCIGRLAFPIYAFMIVEGYFHTRNLKKYAGRLFLFALLSEIPFNLAMGSRLFYPIHQNVLWSFLISLLLIHWNEKAKETKKLPVRIAVGIFTVLFGGLLGLITMVDFYHAGVLTVLVFYFFRENTLFCRAGQIVGLWYINMELLGGYGYELSLFGHSFFFVRQGLALLALLPVWLYRGQRGRYPAGLKFAFYAFYPLHLLVLGLLKFL